MAKDYYLVLGVPLDAAPDAIRSAFRRLALRYHPDRGDRADPGAFQEVSEAYEVLSDPRRRRRYDRELEQRRTRTRVPPAVKRVRDPEPLISEPVSLAGQPETIRPSFDALLERLTRNVTGFEIPKAEREEPLDFELILAPDEAARGVVIPFEVPVLLVCPSCRGTGHDGLFLCVACDGEGRLIDRRVIDVTIPARARDGMVIEVSLEQLRIKNLWLRVHVRVER